jgi:hypothetical protein
MLLSGVDSRVAGTRSARLWGLVNLAALTIMARKRPC